MSTLCDHEYTLLRKFNEHTLKVGCVHCDDQWLLDLDETVLFDWSDELFGKLYDSPDLTALQSSFAE